MSKSRAIIEQNEKEINVVFSVNHNYVKYLYVAMESLFERNKENELSVYVLSSDITIADKEILSMLADKYLQKLKIIFVNDKLFLDANTNSRISKETYYRLLVPWLLPNEKKALYLDVDMIVNKDLASLYNIDISMYALAACNNHTPEQMNRLKTDKMIKTLEEEIYFMSAPLLMNLEWFREHLTIDDYERVIAEFGEKLIFHDQDIINYLLYGKILLLDDIYSIVPGVTGDFPILNKKIKTYYSFEEIEKKAYLLHYAGYSPWRAGVVTKHYELWWEYAKKSPYFDEIMKCLMENTGYVFGVSDYENALHTVYSPYKCRHNILQYFKENNIKSISLYPAGTMSQVLVDEIGQSEDVIIKHIFDANASGEMGEVKIQNSLEIGESNDTEAIIITAWYYYASIYESIKDRVKIPIISMLDLFSY